MSIPVNIELASHIEDKSRILITPCGKSIYLKGERKDFKLKSIVRTLFVVLLLTMVSTLFLVAYTNAAVTRLYSVNTVVTCGTEVTSHTYSHVSDDSWYQIDTERVGANYVIGVEMIYSTTEDPATLVQIYVFSEAHVTDGANPVAIEIYDYVTLLWEPCFSISATSDTSHEYYITANFTHYINITTSEMKLRASYSVKGVLQSIHQDHTYIELTPGRPVASFTYSPLTPYTGETVAFNASESYDPDGSIVSYFWDFGDGANGTGEITTHIYADDGTYTVTLNVTDNDGLTDTASADITVLNRLPVASFTESATTVLTNEAIYFNASASYDPNGTIVSYFWDFGDGTNGTGVVVNHAYTDDGIYTVTLTVTDDYGATDTETATKTIQNRPPVASFTESAETVLTSETITFNASASYDPDGSITSYFWDFGDGTNSTGSIIDHAYADDGVYTVTLTVTDDDGATASTSSTKTALNRPPVASFTESAETVSLGEVITFDASASYDPDGTIVSYFWDFGDGTNVTGIIVDHAYTVGGNYTVTLTVTDDDGATASVSAAKTVLANQAPVAIFTESAEIVYIGETITFNASDSYDPDGSIVSYYWDFGDGTNVTGVIVTHAYADNGVYTVTLTVTDDWGAVDTATSAKTVLNRLPVAVFTESAETVLTAETITFNASDSYDPDGAIVSYFWDFGDGAKATGIIVEHAYADDGTYTVTLTVTDDDGATDTATSTKTVLNRSPVASFTESATTVFTGETIYFNASDSYDSDGTIVGYFWDFGDGTNATGVTTEHAYADDGVYTVTLTVTDDDGAAASTSATKTIGNSPPVAIFTESATTVFTGEAICFNASDSYDPDSVIVSYFWDFGDRTNVTDVVVTHSYANDETYIVTLTVTDDDGETNTATATKTVVNRSPVASFTESAETAYAGETIEFNAFASYDPDGTVINYFWNFGDGTNTTGIFVEHVYSVNGMFTVMLTVTDNDGESSSALTTKTILGGWHDAAIVNVIPSASEVYEHQVLNVSVVVANEGTWTETFNVTLHAFEVHGWHLVEIDDRLVWYSDGESSGDFLLVTSVTIPTGNPMLTFETRYEIEFLYDFGFVQISMDEGATWVSLENEYTTYEHIPDTGSNIIANLPGFTGTSESWPQWMSMAFNLSDYAGQTVLLGFRYMTDLGHLWDGWYIDNVTINEVVISNQAFEQLDPPPLDAIQTLTVISLAPGSQTTLIFSWNTTGTLSGKCSLSAIADTVKGETDTLDNTFVDGIVEVKINPDIDGDGDVDIYDVVAVAGIYGCLEGEPDWNPKADLVKDGVINIYDVIIVASHYGETIEL